MRRWARRGPLLLCLSSALGCGPAPADPSRDGDPPDGAVDAAADAPAVDADADAGSDASVDARAADGSDGDAGAPDFGTDAWSSGLLDGAPPASDGLLPLPGGGVGGPVLTSNNPEVFEGDGLLYGNARPSPGRGGTAHPLEGSFGVYLHHVNRSGSARWVTLLVTNPNDADVVVSGRGTGLTQTETGGLGLGVSPDYRVSEDWILDTPETTVAPATIEPYRPLVFWQRQVNDRAEVDGRFALEASAPVYVYVVAASTDSANDAVAMSLVDAPGDYRVSGRPPPPFGREAGVYAHDTWQGRFSVAVPAAGRSIAWMVNTATGSGLEPVQAFPALAHYDESAAEAVGMYGNVYDLEVALVHDEADGLWRQVRLTFSSLSSGDVSRYWDGLGLVDDREVVIRHVPGAATTELGRVVLRPGAPQTVRFRAMVPGLTSIPQALALESL